MAMTGNELKERRKGLNLRQEDLARELEVVVSSVARWEQLKDEEIPNSKMLHLALLALEFPTFYVLEYSLKQNSPHIQTINEMIERNSKMILNRNVSNDYLVVGIKPTSEEINELAERFDKTLEESRKSAKSAE